MRCRINGQGCLSLLDTGSEVNLLPASMIDGLHLEATARKLFAANGSPIAVLGEVSTDVRFSRRCKRRVTFVVPEQLEEMMFGMHFLTTFRCGISFAKKKLFLGKCQIPLIRKDGVAWCRRVQVTEHRNSPTRSAGCTV